MRRRLCRYPACLASRPGTHCQPCNTEIPKAERLLKEGADVNAHDEFQRTSLHYASFCGETELVSSYIKKGADVSARDTDQDTPLHTAACGGIGHADVADLLIRKGADVDASGQRAGHASAHCGGRRRYQVGCFADSERRRYERQEQGPEDSAARSNIIGRRQYRGGCFAD